MSLSSTGLYLKSLSSDRELDEQKGRHRQREEVRPQALGGLNIQERGLSESLWQRLQRPASSSELRNTVAEMPVKETEAQNGESEPLDTANLH